MSALPNRIRQQAELANQLAAKAKSGTLTMEDVRSPTLTPAAPAPMGEQPMPKGFQPQPAGTGVPGLGTPGFQPQAPTAPNAQAPAAPNAPAPADDQAEHRYKVLQGKYNAEVPRLTGPEQRALRTVPGNAEPALGDPGSLGRYGTAATGPSFGPTSSSTESRNS